MTILTVMAFCILITSLEKQAGADTHYVPGRHATIQAAIDAAADGDQIEVAPGTYKEAINFNGKAVRLHSSGGPAVTIIDANGIAGAYHVVQCVNSEDANTILEGFTISGGGAYGPAYPDGKNGGGMYNYQSSPTVTGCIFTGNTANWNGGAMANNNNSNPTVTNCTFIGNTAAYCGGGMYNIDNSSPTVTNCTFTGNRASYGGAMFNNRSNPTVTNCILWNNLLNEMYNFYSSPSVTYSTVKNGYRGTGNIYLYDVTSTPTVMNNGNPVLVKGTGEDWDTTLANSAIAVDDNGVWHLIYEGARFGATSWQIGYSSITPANNPPLTTDNITFTNAAAPFVKGQCPYVVYVPQRDALLAIIGTTNLDGNIQEQTFYASLSDSLTDANNWHKGQVILNGGGDTDRNDAHLITDNNEAHPILMFYNDQILSYEAFIDCNLEQLYDRSKYPNPTLRGSGFPRTATNSGTGITANCLVFDGFSDYLQFGTYDGDYSYDLTPIINWNAVDWSISVWAKQTSGSSIQTIVTNRHSAPACWWEMGIYSTNNMYVKLTGEEFLSIGAAAPSINQWHQYVLTYDASASSMKVYLDNCLLTTKDTAGINIGGLVNFLQIGSCTEQGQYFNGYIDNFMLFNKVLSTQEVDYLWNGGNGTEEISGISQMTALEESCRIHLKMNDNKEDSALLENSIGIIPITGEGIDNPVFDDSTEASIFKVSDISYIGWRQTKGEVYSMTSVDGFNWMVSDLIAVGNANYQFVFKVDDRYFMLIEDRTSDNLNADPCFVDASSGNLRLKAHSPCIDAGTNAAVPVGIIKDLGGLPRFTDSCKADTGSEIPPIVDIGSYEFLAADFDFNSSVDMKDFALFALKWLENSCGLCEGADMTCDGNVGCDDLAIFLDLWLEGL